jgi:hypothetical protein
VTPRDASASPGSPTPPDDPRLSVGQILRLHERVRERLLELRSELGSPAVDRVVRSLEKQHAGTISPPLDRLRAALEELITTVDATNREVANQVPRFSREGSPRGPEELPPGLARFVMDRSACPGFSFETDRDPVRGWVLRWRELLDDGSIRASGILYEHPHAWMGD